MRLRGLTLSLDKYHGVEKGRENRKERLESLPNYKVLDLMVGGFCIIRAEGGDERTFASDNAVKAMKEMGVYENGD